MKILLSLVVLALPTFAQADWSCECSLPDEGEVVIVDGASKEEAAKTCSSEEGFGGEVLSCSSNGRGDR